MLLQRARDPLRADARTLACLRAEVHRQMRVWRDERQTSSMYRDVHLYWRRVGGAGAVVVPPFVLVGYWAPVEIGIQSVGRAGGISGYLDTTLRASVAAVRSTTRWAVSVMASSIRIEGAI